MEPYYGALILIMNISNAIYGVTGPIPISLQMDTPRNEVGEYFESLGYKVSWDFSKRTGVYWYEIIGTNGLVAQIDKGVPLATIIKDLIAIRHNGNASDPKEYTISFDDESEDWKELLKKVEESQQINKHNETEEYAAI